MINESMLRGSENMSSLHNTKQVLGSRGKGVVRAKGNALGDVRNTLHSRPTANSTSKTPLSKTSSVAGKSVHDENAFSVRKTYSTDRVKQVKPESCSTKKQLSTPKLINHDFHDHNQCEQADDIFFNTILNDFKMDERNLKTLARGFKTKFVIPISRTTISHPICEEIEVLDENRIWEDKSSLLNDSFDDLPLPDICPPKGY